MVKYSFNVTGKGLRFEYERPPFWQSFTLNLLSEYKYNFWYRTGLTLFLSLQFQTLSNWADFRTGNIYGWISGVLSVIANLLLTGLIPFIFFLWLTNKRKILEQESGFMKSSYCLFFEYKPKQLMCKLFSLIFLLRRWVYMLGIIFLREHPLPQVVLLITIVLLQVGYQLIWRPFKVRANNLMMTVNEVFLLVCACIFFKFLESPIEMTTHQVLGYTVISLIVLMMVLTLLYIWISRLLEIFWTIRSKIRNRGQKKSKLRLIDQPPQRSRK